MTHFPHTAQSLFGAGRILAGKFRRSNKVTIDGVTIRPNMGDIEFAKANPTKLVPITNLAERVESAKRQLAANEAKWERFVMFCEQDGVDPNAGTHCPDGMGYPVKVEY